MQPPDARVPRFGRVRPVFWLLLTGAVLLTMLAPAFVLWRASVLPLAARACLWPAAPQDGAPAYVVVTVTNPRDRSVLHGPWAQLVVNWDMSTMSMGSQAVVMHGPSDGAAPASSTDTRMFAIPLRLTMAGPWWARISMRTPGRPTWSALLRFSVGPPGGTSAAHAPSFNPCGAGATA